MNKKNVIKMEATPMVSEEATTDAAVAPIEWRIWEWLTRYGKLLGMCTLCFVLVCFSILATKWFRGKQIQHYAAQYGQQKTLEERLQWADRHLPNGLRSLQGFTFLEKAKEDFNKKDYKSASLYYQKATEYLTISPLLEHAQLGYAYAKIYASEATAAEPTLQKLTRVQSATIKAQAFYALGYLAHKKADNTMWQHCLDELSKFPEGANFLNSLNILKLTENTHG